MTDMFLPAKIGISCQNACLCAMKMTCVVLISLSEAVDSLSIHLFINMWKEDGVLYAKSLW